MIKTEPYEMSCTLKKTPVIFYFISKYIIYSVMKQFMIDSSQFDCFYVIDILIYLLWAKPKLPKDITY